MRLFCHARPCASKLGRRLTEAVRFTPAKQSATARCYPTVSLNPGPERQQAPVPPWFTRIFYTDIYADVSRHASPKSGDAARNRLEFSQQTKAPRKNIQLACIFAAICAKNNSRFISELKLATTAWNFPCKFP